MPTENENEIELSPITDSAVSPAPTQGKAHPSTIAPEDKTKNGNKNDKDDKDKSFMLAAMEMAKSFQKGIVEPFNNMLTEKLFGTTLDKMWDDPIQAGKDFAKKMDSYTQGLSNTLIKVGDLVANIFSKGNSAARKASNDGDGTEMTVMPNSDSASNEIKNAVEASEALSTEAKKVQEPSTEPAPAAEADNTFNFQQ